MLILVLASAVAATWTVDGTSLQEHYGRRPVQAALDCREAPSGAEPQLNGAPLTTLGVAVVAYSKKQGTMTWGHASLRAVYCLGDQLVDAEYEVYRLSGWNEGQLRDEHEGEPFAESSWLKSQRGAKVLFRNRGPVDQGWYAEAQARNREIYEVWLDLPQAELDQVVIRAERAWSDQLERLRAHQDLPERYRPIANNCTAVFRDFLPPALVEGSPFTPFAFVRRLAPEARALVMYPSHHLINRWEGELPESVERIRPVFRRSRRIRRSYLPPLRGQLADDVPAWPGSCSYCGEHAASADRREPRG